ncbi:MAG TPA: RNA 3'-terminal phosphate cyclase [Gemmataceae bacterium]|nr:RNA 3'-terminal phosphate cyclase [Gemmataceae bacterium]
MLELDGSFGEGGGQILRTSLALSLITGKPFHLRNVRAKRSKPGLQPQHLMSVRAAATVGQATVRGDSKGSTDLVFEPGEVRPGNYRFDIGTAGATGLVLHTLYLPLMLGKDGPSELTLTGGTHVIKSPCFHFLDITWRAYLEQFGLRLRLRMDRPGFYPRGGGAVQVFLQPCAAIQAFRHLHRGPVRVSGFSAVAGLPDQIARRQARRATVRLKQHDLEADVQEETWEGGPGTVLALALDTSPAPTLFFGLGERGKPAERVADDAVDQVFAYLGAGEAAAVDAHSADQIVLPLALAKGPSEYTVAEVTLHLLTNVAVIRQFLARDIVCEGEEGKPGRVRIA